MRVDPIKLNLKPPGTKRLKLKCDVPLSDLAFKFHLRHYTEARPLIFQLWWGAATRDPC